MSDERKKRRVFLGMPGYGKQTSAAGRAFWRACRSDVTELEWSYSPSSLLACNFNKLWCEALNAAHAGTPFDYFAMLHDDIGAEDFWLDTLIDELEAKQLDVLGVVVPIKDTRGMTSIALHHPGDNWNIDCRLTLHDVFQLPETFTEDDLGGKQLLLNTGCWVAKWNQEWGKKAHVELNDRIVFDRGSNAYRPENESEDWFFSRCLNEMGLRIGATRKIAVKHEGDAEFQNTFAWGTQAFDNDSQKYPRRVSPVPGVFPIDIPGWLLEAEGRALAELCRGKHVLEIGSYCGLSTVCIGRTAKSVACVDYFDGRGTPSPRDTRPEFNANIERYGLADKVTAMHPDALEGADWNTLGPFDVAFIDGAHDHESVQADVEKCLPLLADDGLLAFHDFKHPCHGGIERVIDDLVADGGEILSVHETLAVVRPPARIPLEV